MYSTVTSNHICMIPVVQDITRLLDILMKITYFTCNKCHFNIIYDDSLGTILELSSSPTPSFFFLFLPEENPTCEKKSKRKKEENSHK